MIHYRKATNAEEIADLLHNRGRIVIEAPPQCGKTTELLRYAENRYPNGRFAVVAKPEHHAYITRLHWLIANGMTFVDVVAKRLLGEELEGEEINPPKMLTEETVQHRTFNASTATFCDGWNEFTEEARRAIMKRRLFIAAVTTGENTHASSQED